MIKVKNKFNIGDIVYAADLSDKDKSQYKVVRVTSIIKEDTSMVVTYDIRNIDGRFDSYLFERFFLEDELFWTYEECINRKDSGTIIRATTHFKGFMLRMFYLALLFFTIVPFCTIQLIHFLLTGRRESHSYFLMIRLTNKTQVG